MAAGRDDAGKHAAVPAGAPSGSPPSAVAAVATVFRQGRVNAVALAMRRLQRQRCNIRAPAPMQLPAHLGMRPIIEVIRGDTDGEAVQATPSSPCAASTPSNFRVSEKRKTVDMRDKLLPMRVLTPVEDDSDSESSSSSGSSTSLDEPGYPSHGIRVDAGEPGTPTYSISVGHHADALGAKIVPKLLTKVRQEQEEISKAIQRMKAFQAEPRPTPLRGRAGLTVPQDGNQHNHLQKRLTVLLGVQPIMEAGLPVEAIVEEPPSILKHIALSSKRADRLERVKRLAAHRLAACREECKWEGVTKKDRHLFAEIFRGYDHSMTGFLKTSAVQDALGDLGLRPENRQSKIEFAMHLQQCGGALDFKQFCKLATDRRRQVADNHRHYLRRLFRQYDRDNSGSLGAEELLQVFSDLALNPECDDERMAFMEAVLECDSDRSGEIEWHEFEPLVHLVRERLVKCRREREVRIWRELELPADVFHSFRGEWISIYDAFVRHDRSGTGLMRRRSAGHFLLRLGIVRSTDVFDRVLRGWPVAALPPGGDGGGGTELPEHLDFPTLLQVVQKLRDDARAAGGGEMSVVLRQAFESYDEEGCGRLRPSVLPSLLGDVGIDVNDLPLDMIEQFVDEADTHGSGVDFRQLRLLVQRTEELHRRRRYDEEQELSEALGFGEEEIWDLRDAFNMIDAANEGQLDLKEVECALKFAGVPASAALLEDGLRQYDKSHPGKLRFAEFMKVMRDAQPFLRAASTDSKMLVRRLSSTEWVSRKSSEVSIKSCGTQG